jgi:HTH-like domain
VRSSSRRRPSSRARRGELLFGSSRPRRPRSRSRCSARCSATPRSGFHAWQRRAPSRRALGDASLLKHIREIRERTRGVYGAPRLHAQLRHEGVRVGRKRVERLMRQAGLSGLVKKKRARTTIRVPGVRTAPDLVERDFASSEPNRLWCADITYVRTWGGLAVPGRGDGLLLAADRRLGNGRPPQGGARRRGARDGRRPPSARPRTGASLRRLQPRRIQAVVATLDREGLR